MKFKTWFIFLGFFWLVCLYLFYTAFVQAKTNAITELNLRQMLHARQAASGIERTFDHWIRVAQNAAQSEAVVNLDDEGLRSINQIYEAHGAELQGLVRVGPDGRVLAIAPHDASMIGQDISAFSHFQKAKNTEKPAVSELITAPRGFSTVAIHVPVMKNGAFDGVLATALDFHEIAREYLSEIRIGETGYAWMISREGLELYCPVPGHTGRSVYENCRDFPSILDMADDMLAGKQGETTYTFNRIRGQEIQEETKHAVFMPIKVGDTFWSIVVATSEKEVLAGLTDFRNKLILILLVVMVGGLFIAYLGAKSWGIIREENKRRLAEEALRDSEEKYRATFESIPDIITITQVADGRYSYVNEAFWAITGYSREEVLGRTPRDIDLYVDFEDRNHMMRMLQENGQLLNYEVKFRKKDGAFFDALFSAKPLTIDNQECLVALTKDITVQKKMEEDKERLQTQLQQAQKMEAVGTLAGGVAHDFNNLLQAINGYTQLLLLDAPIHTPEYSSLKAIQDAGNRAAELVRQLLLFSRKADSERRLVELNAEIEQARRILGRTIPKMVDIEFRSDARLWPLLGDPVQIEQILLNLGTNAADAMPDGGKLLIETENVTLDDESAQTPPEAAPGRYVLLTVSDTGHGMDTATLEKIFDPFFTTKPIGKGTGLGLASVYGIVKSHDGYITCHSHVGQGTTFRIYLPAMEQQEAAEQKETGSQPSVGGTETILVIDDEELVRDFASLVLNKFGYRVLTAASGEEAISIYSGKSGEIDLIIMDIGMPGMGGHKCLQELLQIDPAAKVLIASGYSSEGPAQKTVEAGAAGYVGKPYQLTDLLNKIRAVLGAPD
jgi:PAS domain S-box-containing protein